MAQIKSEQQYKAMMARIDELFFATDENTPEDDPRLQELDVLSALVEEYEQEHYPIETPTMIEMMKARLVENNWTQKDMASLIGMTAPRLNAVLSDKADPTFEQAKLISKRLNINPAIVLAQCEMPDQVGHDVR